jgi:ABC-type bacteriocin/lantibiotic exporter with double-glycine peptidase domain
MADLRDILFDDEEQLNEDELRNYLDDNLPENAKRAFEKKMENSGFVYDAVDGLKAFKNKEDLNTYVKQLNKNLEKQLATKKKEKEKRKIKEFPWIFTAVLIILLLCVMGYIAIHFYGHS